MSVILVINSGSSSMKYSLIDPDAGRTLAAGLIERIGNAEGVATHTVRAFGEPGGAAPAALEATRTRKEAISDHDHAFQIMHEAFGAYGPPLGEHPPIAIGHRVVHGGSRFVAPALITAEVEAEIDALSVLAPLHNPANLAGILAAKKAFPDIPHVAVFDTAFHQTLSPAAYSYAIDVELAREHQIRRYGFHGTSHRFVSHEAARFLGRDVAELRQIVFHLGNGASVTAVEGGRSVQTSMGLTPLEGLVMGTRSGDIDPAIVFHLARTAGASLDDLDSLLNNRSGLLGLSGRSDMRDLLAAVDAGDAAAILALDVYIRRLRSYAGAYIALLGGVDVISFTAGVGENVARVRAGAIATLGFLGVRVDAARNEAREGGIRRISTDDSAVEVLVVPTDEEREIAQEVFALFS